MSDIETFISGKKAQAPGKWGDFEKRYEQYAIGMLLGEYRERAGLSLGELARRSKMAKSALSRLEKHGKDVRLSTLMRYVEAIGQPLQLTLSPAGSGARGRRGRPRIALVGGPPALG